MCCAETDRVVVERFAPSPTGPLHLGHAFSALTAWEAARGSGTFLIRIEDIDQTRAREKWEALIFEDMKWLGLDWPDPVLRQSERFSEYRRILNDLWMRGLLYPCSCTRRDIEEATRAPQEGARHGPDGLAYPGTCRPPDGEQTPGNMPDKVTLRLDTARAVQSLAPVASLDFTEIGPRHHGTHTHNPRQVAARIGDIVLARKDFGTSYHLSVVADDAVQGVTHVTRGEDLFDCTQIHVLLQHLLELPTPIYRHHRLIRDDDGKRLAKRDDARAISAYRAEGASPADIRAMVGLPAA